VTGREASLPGSLSYGDVLLIGQSHSVRRHQRVSIADEVGLESATAVDC
jgi:hypothetical protein